MLTDAEALTLIEKVRRHTPHLDVVELCDWALARLIQKPVSLTDIDTRGTDTPKLSDRAAYMRDYMKKRRREKRDG